MSTFDKKKRPGYNAVIQAEYRLLNALVRNKEYLSDSRVTEDLFVDEVAKSIFCAITNLHLQNIEITPASLLQAGIEIDFNVNEAIVEKIFSIDEVGASSLEDIIPSLKNSQLKSNLIMEIDKLKDSLSAPGTLERDDILSRLYKLDDIVENGTTNDSILYSFDDWSDKYLEELESRRNGKKYTYGDDVLDKYLFKGAYPGAITTIAGSPGMGKSTFAMYIANNFLERNLPVVYISLEMSGVDQFDRLMSMRRNLPSEALYDPDSIDDIIEQVKEEKDFNSDKNNFFFCEEPNLSISSVKSIIKEFKKRTHNDYALVIIDLVTQLKDFMSANNSTSTAASMEIGMNNLNALAKETNTHIIGLAQFRRASDQVHVSCEEDLNKLRPTLSDIKNSGALAERSRVVLSCFRKQYYREKYLQDSTENDPSKDTMEVQILKNSSGESGKLLPYTFVGKYYKLIPIIEGLGNENVEFMSEEDKMLNDLVNKYDIESQI